MFKNIVKSEYKVLKQFSEQCKKEKGTLVKLHISLECQ